MRSASTMVVALIVFAACGGGETNVPKTSGPKPVEGIVGSPSGMLAGSAPVSGVAGTGAIGPAAGPTPTAPLPGTGATPPPSAARAGAPAVPPQGNPMPAAPPPAMGDPMMAPPRPAMPAPAGAVDPKIPAATEMCPEFKNGTITFMGLSGITVVAGMKAAAPTAPMVFYWHGTGSVASEYTGSAAPTSQGVQQEGGVLISFQGTTGGDLLSGTSVFGMGDLRLVDQLVGCAVKNHNIDPRRIFTTGCSAGGLFAAAMATLRSSYVAAAAPNSGGWTTPLRFETAFAPALMTMHGKAGQDVVIVDFSTTSATADKAFKGAGGFVLNCDHGGGHCGARSLAPDVWKFFKAHPYGVKPSPWAGGLPADFSKVCKIY